MERTLHVRTASGIQTKNSQGPLATPPTPRDPWASKRRPRGAVLSSYYLEVYHTASKHRSRVRSPLSSHCEFGMSEGPRTGGPGRRHDRPPGVWGRPGKWPKSDEFSRCEQQLRGVNSSQAGCGAVAPQRKFCVLGTEIAVLLVHVGCQRQLFRRYAVPHLSMNQRSFCWHHT